jgi:hypothetical protein
MGMTRILWTQRQDIGPSARAGAASAFDADRSRTVLFGGRTADGANGDTWEWEGNHWTQVQDSGPAARAAAAMAYGSAGVVLFGGELDAAVAGSPLASDTWSWNGSDWTQVADTGPLRRSRSSLAFDSTRGQYVLFGGSGDSGELGDTWTWDGSAWTQVADTGPSSRAGHAMAYDAARERVVLFGGLSGGQASGETWTWDGTAWTQAQDTGPSPRSGHVLAGDATSVWLFGGGSAPAAGAVELHGDSWEWDGSAWTQRQDIGPSPRVDASAAMDSGRGRIMLFGGAVNGATSNTTELSGDTWEARMEDVTPGPGPGAASPDFTIDASELMVAGSELGFVTVALAATASADLPVSVAVNGAAESLSSPPVRAGESGSRAFFSLAAHGTGPLQVQVTVGTTVADATVTVVGGQPLHFIAAESHMMRGSSAPFQVYGGGTSPDARVYGICFWDSFEILGQTQMLGPHGAVAIPVSIGPSVSPGPHRLIAMSRGGSGPGALSVAGPVDVTIT